MAAWCTPPRTTAQRPTWRPSTWRPTTWRPPLCATVEGPIFFAATFFWPAAWRTPPRPTAQRPTWRPPTWRPPTWRPPLCAACRGPHLLRGYVFLAGRVTPDAAHHCQATGVAPNDECRRRPPNLHRGRLCPAIARPASNGGRGGSWRAQAGRRFGRPGTLWSTPCAACQPWGSCAEACGRLSARAPTQSAAWLWHGRVFHSTWLFWRRRGAACLRWGCCRGALPDAETCLQPAVPRHLQPALL